MLLSFISLVPILVIFFWNIQFANNGEVFDDCMDIKYTNSLRGILAILIVVHHFSGYLTNNYVFSIFNHIGYLIVALFFYLSSYGLMYGVKNKEDYFKNFLLIDFQK